MRYLRHTPTMRRRASLFRWRLLCDRFWRQQDAQHRTRASPQLRRPTRWRAFALGEFAGCRRPQTTTGRQTR